MYNAPGTYSYPYYMNTPMFQSPYYPCWPSGTSESSQPFPQQYIPLRDYGPNPFVVNIEEVTKQNDYFRVALWTGNHLQLTLMSINVGEDIGLEMHPNLDQFIRIEQGQGLVMMGKTQDWLDFRACVREDYAFIIPAGTWHNLINTGNLPLKLYSIYAPPQHPFGTIHPTKRDAEEHHTL